MIDDAVLRRFVGRDLCSEVLRNIFARDGLVAASDTHALCCRARREGEPERISNDAGSPPSIKTVIESEAYATRLARCDSPLPDTDYDLCEHCGGEGYTGAWIDCDCCDGTGLCQCDHCGDEHECGRCRGSGYEQEGTPCYACGRAGIVHDGEGVDTVTLDGVRIRARHMYALCGVPDVLYGVGDDGYGRKFIAFRGGEYYGVILGMREGEA